MSTRVDTSFSRYTFTEDEALQAEVLTVLQKQRLQNLMSEAAETQIALVVDPNNINEFLQQQAYNSAKIELIKYLLEASEVAENELLNQVRQQQQST